MNCLHYNRILNKVVPGILIPNKIYTEENSKGRKYFVQLSYDSAKYSEYNVSKLELDRYGSEFVNIHDIYPANTQAQINYAMSVIPNLVTNNTDELNRYEAIINMITNIDGYISEELFYILANIVSYELLFLRCTYEERMFLYSLSLYILTDQPSVVYVPQMIRMYKRILNKFNGTPVELYGIENYNNYSEHFGKLPITLNISVFTLNTDFIVC